MSEIHDDPPSPDETKASPSQRPDEPELRSSETQASAAGDPRIDDPADELPEWEPLTPDLVEEEAIRGDYVLRGAAILLAMLLGWSQVDRTRILVDVKSGQYLASHGFLPPSHDVLSATAVDREWVNVSWLWDLFVAGVDRIAGPTGFTIVSALIALATFWLVVRTSIPGVSTWWGSVCAVLAAIACFPSLSASSAIVTLLGVAIVVHFLFRWQFDSHRSLWPLVGVFLLWGNLDSRAWIGAGILVLYLVGAWLDGFRDLPQSENPPSLTPLAVVTAGSLLALLVNPFLWSTWLAPVRMYGLEYPGLRAYVSSDDPYLFERYSALTAEFWENLSLYSGLSLLLMAIAGVTLLMNRQNLRLSAALVLLGVNFLGMAGGRELAIASIVNAAVATINGQLWYRRSIRQTYSVDPAELLFSRGGRAVTVIAIFATAFAAVSGHLMGANGRRIGMGFESELNQQIESYQKLLADSFDDRAFNFRLEQGDVLIWLGMKPFIDSRVELYGGENSLIAQHQQIRQAMRSASVNSGVTPQEAREQRDLWTAAFNQFQLNQVLPRLSGREPDYLTYYNLLTNRDWQLTAQEAASASFYRTNSDNPALAEYLRQHQATSFVTQYLREEDPAPQETFPRGVWPRSPSFYDEYVYLPQDLLPNGVRRALHYDFLRNFSLSNRKLEDSIALAYEAIRNAREGLREDPHNAVGYRVLGAAYRFLDEVERSFQQSGGTPHPLAGRFYETVTSYQQALDCQPDDAQTRYTLYEVYDAHRRFDLALAQLKRVQELTGVTTVLPVTNPQFNEQQEQNDARLQQLQELVAEVRLQTESALATNGDRLAAGRAAYAAGCPQLALEILEQDLTVVASNPLAQLFMSLVLMEVGRTSEARDQLEALRGSAVEQQAPEWPTLAAYASLAADDAGNARAILQKNREDLEQLVTVATLESALLHPAEPVDGAQGELAAGDLDAVSSLEQSQTAARVRLAVEARLEQNELLDALIAVEVGEFSDAIQLFDQIITQNPRSSARPLIEQYLLLLAERQLPPPPEVTGVQLEPELTDATISTATSNAQSTPAPAGDAVPEDGASADKP